MRITVFRRSLSKLWLRFRRGPTSNRICHMRMIPGLLWYPWEKDRLWAFRPPIYVLDDNEALSFVMKLTSPQQNEKVQYAKVFNEPHAFSLNTSQCDHFNLLQLCNLHEACHGRHQTFDAPFLMQS